MSFTFFKKSEKSAEAKVSDYEIISLCQLGDKLAFKELVKRYQKVVYALYVYLEVFILLRVHMHLNHG
jgi:hypothetical protein